MMNARTTPGDTELLRSYLVNHDQDSFAILVRRHINWIYGVALRQLRDSAEAQDVTQSVFLLLLNKANRFGDADFLSPWLFRSTMLLCRDAAKRRRRRELHERKAAEMRATTSSESDASPSDIACQLDRAIARLRRSDQQVVLLRFFHQFTHEQTASVLGISEPAVKMRISRALRKLREMLETPGSAITAATIETELLHQSFAPPEAFIQGVITTVQVNTACAMSVPVAGFFSLSAAKVAGAIIVIAGVGIGIGKIAVRPTAHAAPAKSIAHTKTPPPPTNEYFIVGVKQPGGYLVPPTSISQALTWARGPAKPVDANTFVVIISHNSKGISVYRYQPLMTRINGIRPLDRKFENGSTIEISENAYYGGRIAAGDLLLIAVADPDNPGSTTDLRLPVTETGNVLVPRIGNLDLAGQTMPQAEQTVRQAYQNTDMIHSALVSVARLKSSKAK